MLVVFVKSNITVHEVMYESVGTGLLGVMVSTLSMHSILPNVTLLHERKLRS